ncbi:hypothetical protein [uncultured Microbulbifer sp.]|uniref:hypothetical protein n=1 Tax=uncultured Microbulbifer sp. TaxID=348147 RepID=UPI002613FEA6|nr:hypothetical protein [uncultured Microbulbifer sp.]
MEADGTLLLLNPKVVFPKLLVTFNCISWSALTELYQLAGFKEPLEELDYSLLVDEALPTQGAEEALGGVVIYSLSDAWMYFAKKLVEQGRDIELYGVIERDGGNIEYYAVRDGLRFVEEFSRDGDEDNTALTEWLAVLPNDVQEYFLTQVSVGCEED